MVVDNSLTMNGGWWMVDGRWWMVDWWWMVDGGGWWWIVDGGWWMVMTKLDLISSNIRQFEIWTNVYGRRTVQIVHNNFDDFFGNDRPKLDQLSSNIRQFEIWTKWTILTSVLWVEMIILAELSNEQGKANVKGELIKYKGKNKEEKEEERKLFITKLNQIGIYPFLPMIPR
ncbi:unnamed protein product [Rhizophagus irregularis]|nr:unnamed protein product [Rhizophagus irregularis]